MTNATPDPIDVYVGAAIRAGRKGQGCSQQALAAAIGVTFQQVQKYENGGNRISASMLSRVASCLGQRVESFFPADDQVLTVGAGQKMAGFVGGLRLAQIFLELPVMGRAGLVKVAEAMRIAFSEEEAGAPGRDYVTGGDPEAARHVA